MQRLSNATSGKHEKWVTLALPWLERQGKRLYGEHFRIYEEDYALLNRLLAYFSGDQITAEAQGLSLRKGILLTGPVGCGKTCLMTLLRLLLLPAERYRVVPCRQVSFAFQRDGFDVIGRYSNGGGGKPLVYCFDDLGAEQVQRHYGNTCQVMGEVLLSRYDLFISSGLKTHMTTNLTSTEIEQVYGLRVRSRMREMFNLVSFAGQAEDKRT
ncbi:ATPase [Pontibacter litorisediminis]|uniref:ATPase n=1 Tax=Pontibacter litorisediminis TaxID=1846260 RepID=UPI0023ECE97E|nr:ATPase [Pontibacter litorisediminis]